MKLDYTKKWVCLFIFFGFLSIDSMTVVGIHKEEKTSRRLNESTLFWLSQYHSKGFHSKYGNPNAGSIESLRELCSRALYVKSENKPFLSAMKKEYYNFTGDLSARPRLLKDKLEPAKWRRPTSAGLKLKFLFEIDNAFKQISSVVKVGYDVYFMSSKNIHRINPERWHNYVTAARSDIMTDLGRNRVVGYCPANPLTLCGFNWSFSNEVQVDLPDYRMRLELHKLDDRRFLFQKKKVGRCDKTTIGDLFSLALENIMSHN